MLVRENTQPLTISIGNFKDDDREKSEDTKGTDRKSSSKELSKFKPNHSKFRKPKHHATDSTKSLWPSRTNAHQRRSKFEKLASHQNFDSSSLIRKDSSKEEDNLEKESRRKSLNED